MPSYIIVAVFSACFACLLTAVLLWRRARKRVAEETREKVMASVMDAHNNFLTNMVYFKNRAKVSGIVTSEDLSQIDTAISTAQKRLIEIAETDLTPTRDLGGIKVIARKKKTKKKAG